jgi:arsenite-transporting ATPase
MSRVPDSARLGIFCGKGGVGKTTLSLAAGLRHAMSGRRVLVISSHPLAELALSVSLENLAIRFPVAAANLFVLHIDPRELIGDVVRKNFPVAAVAQRVLASSVFKNLIDIAPGLKEFFFLGRLQELAERRKRDSASIPDYDYLIWDAPASGHFLTTLRSARGFDVFLAGPLANAGARMQRFFSSPGNIRLFPVTSLEEMAIAETIELTRAMSDEFGVGSSALLVNCASPVCAAPEERVNGLEEAAGPAEAMRFAVRRGMMERERCAELRAALPVPQTLIPRITLAPTDLDLLEAVGSRLGGAIFS